MVDDDWTNVVPMEVGSYYFYGDIGFKKDDPNFKAELSILHVHPIQNGVMHVVAGQFFFPENKGWDGKFKNMDIRLPVL